MRRKIHPYLGFNDFWFIIIGVIVLGIFIPIVFFNADLFDKKYPYINEVLEAMIFSLGYWVMSRKIIIHFRKKIPDFQDSKKRILKVVISCVVGAFLLSILLIPLVNILFRSLNLVTAPTSAVRGIINTYTVTFFILAIYESIWFFSQLKLSYEEKEQIKIAHLQTPLDGLRNQVNPHFLFNSLNTISSLIYKDVEQAGVFIRQLAKLYQYTLDSYDLKLVSLEEELAFVNSYLFLIKTRFQESFDFKIQLPKELNQTKVPPLALQMLIENAVKHNQLLKDNPLVVEVSEENGFISITNNITEAPIKVTSFKIGLKNINSRYLIIAGRGIEVSNGKHFQVKIPIIR